MRDSLGGAAALAPANLLERQAEDGRLHEILRAARGLLAADDVGERRHGHCDAGDSLALRGPSEILVAARAGGREDDVEIMSGTPAAIAAMAPMTSRSSVATTRRWSSGAAAPRSRTSPSPRCPSSALASRRACPGGRTKSIRSRASPSASRSDLRSAAAAAGVLSP